MARHSVETQHWRKISTLIAKSTKQISEHGQHKPLARSNGMSRPSSLTQLMFAAALAEAEALNAEGNEAGCLLAAGRAKQMRELG